MNTSEWNGADVDAMVELQEVVKRYGKFEAVRGVSFRVPRGKIFGFLGPNGAGKTTTIRMLSGVLRPTSGVVKVGGVNVELDPEGAKAKIGYIPDRPYLYEKLSGAEFLRFVAGLWGHDPDAAEARADKLLELFQLQDRKHDLIESFSHGMRQKLLITSALVHEPELIVVDEPMVGLDPRAAKLLKDLFRNYVEQGGTVFLSTHTLEVAEALCDHIAIIQHGQIIARGSMDELRAQAEAGDAGLEEIFLKVTGGSDVEHALANLAGALAG